jgi:hypothetical protein
MAAGTDWATAAAEQKMARASIGKRNGISSWSSTTGQRVTDGISELPAYC